MSEFDLLGNLNIQIENSIDTCIKKSGFSYNEFALFYTLYFSKDAKCTQKQISNEWYLPKQTIFNVCKLYRQKGWVDFVFLNDDKREKNIYLTPLGKAQIQNGLDKFIKTNEMVFSKFGAKKSARLFALLKELAEIYKEEVEKMD